MSPIPPLSKTSFLLLEPSLYPWVLSLSFFSSPSWRALGNLVGRVFLATFGLDWEPKSTGGFRYIRTLADLVPLPPLHFSPSTKAVPKVHFRSPLPALPFSLVRDLRWSLLFFFASTDPRCEVHGFSLAFSEEFRLYPE